MKIWKKQIVVRKSSNTDFFLSEKQKKLIIQIKYLDKMNL